MITIVYSTQNDDSKNLAFNRHLQNTCNLKDVQIIEYINKNEYSLSELYNRGIDAAKYDIVVCLHNDVQLENGWGTKLLSEFESNPDYGIIGMAGTCNFPSSGIYWENAAINMAGRVYHKHNGTKYLSEYSNKFKELIPVVSIDGLFMAFDKTKIKSRFDEDSGQFNFYDHSFCLLNYLEGVKIGVTTAFNITHDSVGKPSAEFHTDRMKFLLKFRSKIPITIKPNSVYVNKVNETPLKKVGKVAVVIPTKGKTDMLFDCINSYIEHTSNNTPYEIFVADTGSTEAELQQIKKYIDVHSEDVKINLIEYNYYNFAKINNDVVANHISDDFEYILFSNNDIKLLNNVIYGMVKIFSVNKNAGTVGPRMHFADNTVQHNGILTAVNKSSQLIFTHINLNAYYRWNNGLNKVFGNTAGLMMIRKSVFIKCGMFNESYLNCFEDVELNAKCLLLGLVNYNNGDLVAYHYESQTRDDDNLKNLKVQFDYVNNLIPFMQKHINTLINKKVIYQV